MGDTSVSALKSGVKRLASLDAMRGFSILSMIPLHVLVFGTLWAGGGEWSVTSGEGPPLLVVELSKPLATGLIIFFFVTGMSLVFSMAKRRERQSFLGMERHVVFRYGLYVVAGMVFEAVMWLLLSGGELDLLNLLPAIFAGATFSGPIIGIGLTAIVAFPLVYYLSPKKLALLASAVALIVGLALYYVLLPVTSSLPEVSVLNPLIIEGWSVLKSLPIMLVGASVGKLVLDGADMKRTFILVGGAIAMVYMVVPTLYGSQMLHLAVAIWAYPHAILFTVASAFCMFGLFRVLEARNRTLAALRVLGRSPLLVYYGHWLLFFGLFIMIGSQNLSLGVLLALSIIGVAIIWPLTYLYSRRRWGSPSTW